jgi:hypothetical protein
MVWQDQTVRCIKCVSFKGYVVGLKNPSGEVKWLVVVHIGSKKEFMDNGLCGSEFIQQESEMTGELFYDWFKKILPNLDSHCITVIDNV